MTISVKARCIVAAIFMATLVPMFGCEDRNYLKPLQHSPPPGWWAETTKVAGQALPVPKKWLESEEGRFAHGLVPPPLAAAKIVPFDFAKGQRDAEQDKKKHDLSWFYWTHLCDSEAGEWIEKTAENVDGFYFARPVPKPTWPEQLTDLYFLEGPLIAGVYYLELDDDNDVATMTKRASRFISPPNRSFKFVEEPRRDTSWQATLNPSEPYVRMFGYRHETELPAAGANEKGERIPTVVPGTPMRLVGATEPTAKYAYTWRGLRRERDRELGISGIEYIVYDRISREVLSLRRTFVLAAPNPEHTTRRAWLQGTQCPQTSDSSANNEYIEFLVFRTLKTNPPPKLIIRPFIHENKK